IPFVGMIRLFPDHAYLAGDPSLRVDVKPGEFHEYRIVRTDGKMRLSVDGRELLVTDKIDKATCTLAWTPFKLSPYLLSIGNEEAHNAKSGFDWVADMDKKTTSSSETLGGRPTPITAANVTHAVTGHSIWRRFEVKYDHPRTRQRVIRWDPKQGFPDQYQLDHMLEIGATASGGDQGYSGWVQLPDKRIFVVNYTDDTARWNCSWGSLGTSWIRGTFVLPEDLPTAKND
ncbi:MAG: hypothetical protein JXM70_28500, partial [Pirellulales bacterium]|nr:hypothetical protein [Pirellulales bacterium]